VVSTVADSMSEVKDGIKVFNISSALISDGSGAGSTLIGLYMVLTRYPTKGVKMRAARISQTTRN
jgi:hypothetical protein